MDKVSVLHTLRQHAGALQRQYGIQHLMLFGSVARDEASEKSDIDLLVAFKSPPSARQFFDLQFYLEDLLQHPVDLITDQALRKELRPYIEKDLEPVL